MAVSAVRGRGDKRLVLTKLIAWKGNFECFIGSGRGKLSDDYQHCRGLRCLEETVSMSSG